MANTSLLLANPDFDSIEASLKAFLKTQTRFVDYDFEGSNLSMLINLLAYNSYQDAFLSNMAASEMFLDTAQLRSSVVSHAKELGYTPRSYRSAKAVVTIQITADDNPGAIIMPKGTLFITQVGSRTYTFTTDKAYNILATSGSYQVTGIEIFEGFPVTERFTVNSEIVSQRFALKNSKMDTRSLYVTVNGTQYKQASSVLDLKNDSLVYFLQLGNDGYYELVFGGDVIGKQPVHQDVIEASYRVSVGSDSNGARVFRPGGSIAGYTTITVTTENIAQGGDSTETTESIRRNAPLMYQTRNRAVTTDDYKVLLQQQFPEIAAISVYGGEQMDPPQYGRVFIAVDIDSAYGASDVAKEGYYRYIRARSPVTIEPMFIDPNFMFLKLETVVYFDYVNYDTSDKEVETSVLTAVEEFNDIELGDFDTTFKYSQLVKAIDASHPSILSNETTVSMMLSLDSDKTKTVAQKLTFFNEMSPSNRSSTITSSNFIYNNKTCKLQDDGEGNINVVTNLQNATPTVIASVGTVNYTSGEVIIQPFNVTQIFGASIRIYAISQSKNINAVQNMLLNIDTTEINITALPSTK